jgi:hypothetical protein
VSEQTGRRIAAVVFAGIGGTLMYFDEGFPAALGWVAIIAVSYAAVMRWWPPMTTSRKDTRPPPHERRPRTWSQMRQRILDEDYLDVSELEKRKRNAHQMKYGIWLVPATVLGLAPVVLTEGPSWVMIAAIALVLYGGISAYLLGRSWERRWEEVIREKSNR